MSASADLMEMRTFKRPESGLSTRLRRRFGVTDSRPFLAPAAFFALALGLLIYDHVQGALDEPFFWAGVLTVSSVFALLTVRAGTAAERAATAAWKADHDEVTGMSNDRAMMRELRGCADRGEATHLLLLEAVPSRGDLDELPPALIRSLAEALSTIASRQGGKAYRLQALRFALLAPGDQADIGELVTHSRAALGRVPEASSMDLHHGEVRLPDEADTADLALVLATGRILARSRRSRTSPRRQVQAALTAALNARQITGCRSANAAAPLAIVVGRKFGLEGDSLDDLVIAANLHDLGMIAVPESIINSSGSLTPEQAVVIRRHPLEGSKILGAASSLTGAALLVRSAYERFDGTGYPDGLEGTGIPLGARILAPCVAVAAMESHRPHRPPLAKAEIFEQLRDSAGSQFDPEVVDTLTPILITEGKMDPVAA